MTGYDFAAVRDGVTLLSLLEEDGARKIKVRGDKGVCCCPLAPDKTPSFSWDVRTGKFRCFSCGEHGDVFDYVEKSRGCSRKEAMDLLARRAGLGDGFRLPEARHVPVPVIEEKPLAPLAGGDLAVWQEGVAHLCSDPDARALIAEWRGFERATVGSMVKAGLMASIEMGGWLRRQDTMPGTRRVAFAVTTPELGQVGYHVRLKAQEPGGRCSWRYVPGGTGAWPFCLGHVPSARTLLVCEGQWDAMALFELLGGDFAQLAEAGVAIAAMRGATSWHLLVERYLLAGVAALPEKGPVRPEMTAILFPDRDAAGAGWTTPTGDEPCLAEVLRAVCAEVHVREPLEGFGKDINDLLRVAKKTKGTR